MRNSLKSIAIVGVVCLASCASLWGCGDDDDDDEVPVAGMSGTVAPPAGSGGSGGVPPAGTGGAGSGAGTGAGTGGSAGTAAPDCTTAGCPSGQFCVNKMCRMTCTEDPQCGSGESCCDGGCVDTDDASDHCGECGKECSSTERCDDGACTAIKCELDFDASVPLNESNGCPVNEQCIAGSGGEGACMCGDDPSCPTNETCNGSGDCRCGSGAGCASAETCCGGNRCANLDNDENNCGKCGKKCATGATCDDGVCGCDTAGFGECNGVCVDLTTRTNCGGCGVTCETGTTCRDPNGSRPLGCYCPNVNYIPCNGACVELGTLDNCGGCGDFCEAPETVCRNRSCECQTVGQTACGNACVNLDDGVTTGSGGSAVTTHCGACGLTCPTGAGCTNGQCACPGGSTFDRFCDENPVTGATDNVYACINVNTEKNCGDCGLECIDDSDCVGTNGSDIPDDWDCVCRRSDAGKTHCPGLGCRSLTETDSCGECGRVCPSGIACTAGRCACPGGAAGESCTVDGKPACVDTNTDENNCGDCGTVCGNGSECCGGTCVDVDTYDTDELNCGGCGVARCPATCGFFGISQCQCTNGVCQRP